VKAPAETGPSVSKSNENPRSGSLEEILAFVPNEMTPLSALESFREQRGQRQLPDGWDCTVHKSQSLRHIHSPYGDIAKRAQ
jgi:hypothetical protein